MKPVCLATLAESLTHHHIQAVSQQESPLGNTGCEGRRHAKPKSLPNSSFPKKCVPAPLTETFTTMIAKSTSANINGISFHNHEMKKRKKRKAACYNRFFPHPEPCAPESARQLVVPAYERETRERASKQRGSDQGRASWGGG